MFLFSYFFVKKNVQKFVCVDTFTFHIEKKFLVKFHLFFVVCINTQIDFFSLSALGLSE